MPMDTTRRGFLALAAGTTMAAPGILRAQTLRPVTCLTDWLHQGPNCGFAVAKEKGFYAEAGLDVALSQGKGSGGTAQIVANKASMFGFADGFVVGNSVSKGMRLTMVGAVFRRTPTAVIVLDESSIQQPKDLIGKSIGIPTGSAQFQQWPAFVNGAGLQLSQIKVINVDAAGAVPALISGKVDAIAGFAQGWVPSIEIRGNKKARTFWYADHGVNAVSNGIIVHQDTLSDKPLVAAFVRATLKGFLYGRQNLDETAQIIKKYQEASDPAITKREAELSWRTWVTPTTKDKPLGWIAPEDWRATVETLKAYGGVTTDLDPSQLYTNEFVPTEPEFVPPQNA
ncbi:ABC transporter substrate-binding protein [Rhodopseudomonas sp. HC1]|uniref:ABC transporter substrate-binding protein n=1 Tax=Rhodopseudomonas infernalis TaxID=2897386 RepID=UPI001EE790D1|nr:ABC transporter substrate-binding protein [Rhodopseudomonas infernalis]MCG6205279.1 ABC transporter substrate-binding protein [Rhodopseudomonas infernalis]